MRTTFTSHASRQASQRLRLRLRDIARILEGNLSIPIGSESRHKIHRLFWSEPDAFWFVAIQDESDGGVITILPVNYHNRWKVPPGVLEKAKQLAAQIVIDTPMEAGASAREIRPTPKNQPPVFRLTGHFKNTATATIRRVHLGKLPMNGCASIEKLMENPETHRRIREMIRQKESAEECCSEVYARKGRYGEDILVALH